MKAHIRSLYVHPYLPYLPTAMPSRPDTATATVPLLPPSPSLPLPLSLDFSLALLVCMVKYCIIVLTAGRKTA